MNSMFGDIAWYSIPRTVPFHTAWSGAGYERFSLMEANLGCSFAISDSSCPAIRDGTFLDGSSRCYSKWAVQLSPFWFEKRKLRESILLYLLHSAIRVSPVQQMQPIPQWQYAPNSIARITCHYVGLAVRSLVRCMDSMHMINRNLLKQTQMQLSRSKQKLKSLEEYSWTHNSLLAFLYL